MSFITKPAFCFYSLLKLFLKVIFLLYDNHLAFFIKRWITFQRVIPILFNVSSVFRHKRVFSLAVHRNINTKISPMFLFTRWCTLGVNGFVGRLIRETSRSVPLYFLTLTIITLTACPWFKVTPPLDGLVFLHEKDKAFFSVRVRGNNI